MLDIANFKNRLFDLESEDQFLALALEVFKYQAHANPVYAQFLDKLNKSAEEVKALEAIPFLPISFFKKHKVVTGNNPVEEVFTSSATGGKGISQHYVADIKLYQKSFLKGFENFYGPVSNYCVLALLPSYLERTGSSLIFMAKNFIDLSHDSDSGFYLNNLNDLYKLLLQKIEQKSPVLLLGVSFALLDLAETYQLPPNNMIIMETGGMKGRRREMIRSELHATLSSKLGVPKIHSEYGMTEMLSQAYSSGDGKFKTPPWMKILIRETDDPFSYCAPGKTGGINVVDFANIDSCSFLETQDLGRQHHQGTFEVMGRFDNSEIRGCNLLVI